MTSDELLAEIERQEVHSTGYRADDISIEQEKALNYYNRRPIGNEEDGRSQVISSDVWDTVEGMLPLILKPFVSSDEVVRFIAANANDVDAAEQESDYVNFVATQKNAAFLQLYNWVKTGLLQKNGIVKYWWEEKREASIERYSGLTPELLTFLAQDDSIKILESTQNVDGTFDITLRQVRNNAFAKYAVVPPEEFRIARNADNPDPKSSRFVQHVTRRTISDIRQSGYEVDDDISDSGDSVALFSPQYNARRNASETEWPQGSDSSDPSMREVVFKESYLYIDMDGDGIAELRKVCQVGDTILADEETEEIPFCAWSPYVMPFKFYGNCPADVICDVQEIKTTLVRQGLDNLYTINNNRTFVGNGVNLDDMLDNVIGGIVRVEGDNVGNRVMAAPIQPIGQFVQPMIEYQDTAKENRTGFTRYNQGMDADSLNKTATGIRAIQDAANQRIELIGRIFAEVGFKPLMLGLHGLIRRHATQAETVELRGKWVNINPRDWRRRTDMSVSVGLGTGDQQAKIGGLQLQINMQMQAVPLGLVKPENLYASFVKLSNLLGYKDGQRFWTNPTDPANQQQPQQPPPPDPAILKLQADSQMKQAELAQRSQSDQAELVQKSQSSDADRQLEAAKAQAEFELQARELAIKERAQALAEAQANFDAQQITLQAQQGIDQQTAAQALGEQQNALGGAIQELARLMVAPKQIVNDAQGNPVGVQSVDDGKQYPIDQLLAMLRLPKEVVYDESGVPSGTRTVTTQ